MAALSWHDYDQMLQLATAVLDCHEPEQAWHLVGQQLCGPLLGAEMCSLGVVDVPSCMGQLLVQNIPGELADRAPPAGTRFDATLVKDHPIFHYYQHTGLYVPRTIRDVTSLRIWRNCASYAAIRELFGGGYPLVVPLAMNACRNRVFSLLRVERDFSPRDRDLAARVQPLLIGLDRHLGYLARWRQGIEAPGCLEAAQSHARELAITPRELVVLHLLAQGLTAVAIAHRLGISPRTVGRHLGNLYRKLETSDRLATVLRAQVLGLLSPQAPAAPQALDNPGMPPVREAS